MTRYSQDFHSLFGHHIKTLLQSLSIMCWLVDFIVTSSMVSEPNNFLLSNKAVTLILLFDKYLSLKNEVWVYNISMERKICRLHDGIEMKGLRNLILKWPMVKDGGT